MRSFLMCIVLFLSPIPAFTQTAGLQFPELEPLTLENADRFIQLPGTLTVLRPLDFALSTDGRQIAVTHAGGIKLYQWDDLENPIIMLDIPGADDIYGPQFSPDNTILAVNVIYPFDVAADELRTEIQLWDLQEELVIAELVSRLGMEESPIFSPDGNYLAGNQSLYQTTKNTSSDGGSSLNIWSLNDLERIDGDALYGRYGIGDLEFSPDSLTLLWSVVEPDLSIIGGGGGLGNYWRMEYLPSIFTPNPNLGVMTEIVHHLPDYNPEHVSVFLSASEIFTQDTHDIEFNRDGSWLAIIGADSTIWEVITAEKRATLPEGLQFSAFLSDDSILAIDVANNRLYVSAFDFNTPIPIVEPYDPTQQILRISEDSSLLAIWDNETIHFYGVPAN